MLTSPTHEKLGAMHLHAMATAWQDQQRLVDHAALTFDERFGLLVEAQWLPARITGSSARSARPGSGV